MRRVALPLALLVTVVAMNAQIAKPAAPIIQRLPGAGGISPAVRVADVTLIFTGQVVARLPAAK
ncbi:MAG: hypothetical protein RLZZ15_2654 [Verrucomicrobiota bacterium]|jgi:hypothetical protein